MTKDPVQPGSEAQLTRTQGCAANNGIQIQHPNEHIAHAGILRSRHTAAARGEPTDVRLLHTKGRGAGTDPRGPPARSPRTEGPVPPPQDKGGGRSGSARPGGHRERRIRPDPPTPYCGRARPPPGPAPPRRRGTLRERQKMATTPPRTAAGGSAGMRRGDAAAARPAQRSLCVPGPPPPPPPHRGRARPRAPGERPPPAASPPRSAPAAAGSPGPPPTSASPGSRPAAAAAVPRSSRRPLAARL
ncbi:basic proline-rich protein-like [Neopsephotus bourkii]|uniref:basic proline-rich protein-like n=1 Tax=Neopsephotus bourkii TaxID=309878 RepID=UPI002AA53F9C|nr:basic proline-rich protein-like [Neopsephotus bourkii]